MKVNYKPLIFDGKKWEQESINLIRNILEADSDERIIVCHPNLVFNKKLITPELKDFNDIDWEDLKTNLNLLKDIYEDSDIIKLWSYITRRLNYELTDKKYKEPKHLAIVEISDENNYQLRGIVKATKNHMFLANNPFYSKKKEKVKRLAI